MSDDAAPGTPDPRIEPPGSRITPADRWMVRGYLFVVAGFVVVGSIFLFGVAPAVRGGAVAVAPATYPVDSPAMRTSLTSRVESFIRLAAIDNRWVLGFCETALADDLAGRWDEFRTASKAWTDGSTGWSANAAPADEGDELQHQVDVRKKSGNPDLRISVRWVLGPQGVWRLRTLSILGVDPEFTAPR